MNVSPKMIHHTARLNEITQHWVGAGDGPPVYLLHGFPENWYAWRKQIPVLAERYTCPVPSEMHVVQQDPHQLRDRHGWMRVVQLNSYFLRELAPIYARPPESTQSRCAWQGK